MSYTGYAGLGEKGTPNGAAGVAGAINGVATLSHDARYSAANALSAFGPQISFDRSDYRRLLEQAKRNPSMLRDRQVPMARLRNFVYGIIGDVASSAARAEQLAGLRVASESQRARNHRIQADLISASRTMLDAANEALRNLGPVRSGTSGLGNPLLVAGVIAVGGMVYAIVAVTVVTAIALCYDAQRRMTDARAAADRACEAQGGCSAEEYARIVHALQLGPMDALAEGGAAGIQAAGLGVGVTVAIVGASVAAAGALYFLFGTPAGRRTLAGLKEEAK